ncbi:class I SAM-dependent methyltransferase [Teredinibacter haidensis]|uniref:class I SAM-dependent methyltransferase n=1 Tax=Teredinibacter haidensis TaxID=2731755 RepID=UPI0009489630|nr:class I SAM-dependent methyltransferase [Teredinibacter haidensis]
MLTLHPEKLPVRAGDSLLDLGCGEGRHTLGLFFLQHTQTISLLGVDLNFSDLHTANRRLSELATHSVRATATFINSNGLQLPFRDHSFDHIICSEVLEHIHDYEQMLSEINRVLKPGGHLCVSVPRFWPEKICWLLEKRYHQVEGGHIRIFNGKRLQQKIAANGYQLYSKHWSHALHVPYWWLRCLFWKQGETFLPVRLYHRLLVWDLFNKPWLTQTLDKWLNPVMGKSLVLYFTKKP